MALSASPIRKVAPLAEYHVFRYLFSMRTTFLAALPLLVFPSACLLSGCTAEAYRVDAAFNRGAAGQANQNYDNLTPIDLSTFKFADDEELLSRSDGSTARDLQRVGPNDIQSLKVAQKQFLEVAKEYNDLRAASLPPDVRQARMKEIADKRQDAADTLDTILPVRTAYSKSVNDQTSRNRLRAILLEHSDRIFSQHKAAVQAFQNDSNLLFDWTSLITSGLSAAFVPGVTTQALATTSTITQGLQASMSDRVYLKFIAPRILRECDLAREAFRAEIDSRTLEPCTTYTVDDMLHDVQTYHERGSFMYGVMVVATATGIERVDDTSITTATSLTNDKLRSRIVAILSLGLGQHYTLAGDAKKQVVIDPEPRDAGKPIKSVTINLMEVDAEDAQTPAAVRDRERENIVRLAKALLTSNIRGGDVTVHLFKKGSDLSKPDTKPVATSE